MFKALKETKQYYGVVLDLWYLPLKIIIGKEF